MSNNHSAALRAPSMAVPAAPAGPAGAAAGARPSFWRRLVDAWVQSYANRVDSNGNIMIEH
jgi:hypothetical protein